MSDPVFIHSQEYDSYSDFRTLVRLSGFSSCGLDADHTKSTTYIVSPHNGNTKAMIDHWRGKRASRLIWWFLERPTNHDQFKAEIGELANGPYDQVWISDRAMYNLVNNHASVKFVPVGSDAALGTLVRRAAYQFDFTHMSYVWGRRTEIINGINGRLGSNSWGDDRHNVLNSVRFMLNTHQDNNQYSEPLRFALAAAYGLPMISETCSDPYPYEPGVDFIQLPYHELINGTNRILTEHYDQHIEMGKRFHHKATVQFRFRDNVLGNL